MKHLRRLNRIFQLITNLPRGRICLKSRTATENTEDAVSDDNGIEDKAVNAAF